MLLNVGYSQLNLPIKIDSNNQIIHHNGFILSYNETCEQPNWVFYSLNNEDLVCEKVSRSNYFKKDPSIPTGSAELSDYKGSGYDRGHLKPAGDAVCDIDVMRETFYLSNISPQEPSFNRGIWKRLESHIRDIALANDSIHVFTGGILNDTLPTIGGNQVCVPDAYFKVVYIFNDDIITVKSYLLPNTPSRADLETFNVSLGVIEGMSGYDFP
jgi:endonuclease G